MAEENVLNEDVVAVESEVELSDKDKDFVKRFNLRPEHLKYRELANQETEHKYVHGKPLLVSRSFMLLIGQRH